MRPFTYYQISVSKTHFTFTPSAVGKCIPNITQPSFFTCSKTALREAMAFSWSISKRAQKSGYSIWIVRPAWCRLLSVCRLCDKWCVRGCDRMLPWLLHHMAMHRLWQTLYYILFSEIICTSYIQDLNHWILIQNWCWIILHHLFFPTPRPF